MVQRPTASPPETYGTGHAEQRCLQLASEKQRSQHERCVAGAAAAAALLQTRPSGSCKETKLYNARCPMDGRLPRTGFAAESFNSSPVYGHSFSGGWRPFGIIVAVLPCQGEVAAYGLLLSHAAEERRRRPKTARASASGDENERRRPQWRPCRLLLSVQVHVPLLSTRWWRRNRGSCCCTMSGS